MPRVHGEGHKLGRDNHIVLVHGTWANGIWFKGRRLRIFSSSNPRWFEEGSDFHSRLSSELRDRSVVASISSFSWNGENSVIERGDAARELSKLLRERLKADGNIAVIAHSHGGNVAMRALFLLGPDAEFVRLTTLATPFLRIFDDQPISLDALLVAAHLVLFLSWCLIGATVVALLMGALSPVIAPFVGNDEEILFVVIALLGLGCFGVIARLVWPFARHAAAVVARRSHNPKDSIEAEDSRNRDRMKSRLHRIVDASHYSFSFHLRILVLRGVDDEASFALAIAAIGARLSTLHRLTIERILTVIGYIVCGRPLYIPYVIGAIFAVMYGLGYLPIYVGDIALLVGLCVATTVIAGSSALFSGSWFKGVFGRELIRGVSTLSISADSAPDGAHMSIIMTLPPSNVPGPRGLWLRHAIYSNPRCAPSIADWLAGEFREARCGHSQSASPTVSLPVDPDVR